MNLQELVHCIQNAAEELEQKEERTFEDIVKEGQETPAFIAGHILGMRDCLTLIAQIYGVEIEDGSEEE
jgi:hypothetical protein